MMYAPCRPCYHAQSPKSSPGRFSWLYMRHVKVRTARMIFAGAGRGLQTRGRFISQWFNSAFRAPSFFFSFYWHPTPAARPLACIPCPLPRATKPLQKIKRSHDAKTSCHTRPPRPLQRRTTKIFIKTEKEQPQRRGQGPSSATWTAVGEVETTTCLPLACKQHTPAPHTHGDSGSAPHARGQRMMHNNTRAKRQRTRPHSEKDGGHPGAGAAAGACRAARVRARADRHSHR